MVQKIIRKIRKKGDLFMMKKGTILKRVAAGAAVLSLLVGISPVRPTKAYEYNKTLTPPFAGCAKRTVGHNVTKDPYVSPSGSTMSTTYVLIVAYNADTIVASDHIKTGTRGKKNFGYRSGYGGRGTAYQMLIYPSEPDFYEYTVKGDWQP